MATAVGTRPPVAAVGLGRMGLPALLDTPAGGGYSDRDRDRMALYELEETVKPWATATTATRGQVTT